VHTPITIDFDGLPWLPHPTISGIYVRAFQNEAAFAPTDVLIARVDRGGEIPWHVHPTDSEIVYVLQGAGILYSAQDEQRSQMTDAPMRAGQGVIIPAGLWHSVHNTGDDALLALAIHTPC
jgi:mannose-6-phosphate isomerase-like protein (cupin superfamily)